MKITYTKPINTVPFKDILIGRCFIDRDGDICVRTSREESCCENVFCFSDNKSYEFCPSYRVQPVEVELLVHAEEQ